MNQPSTANLRNQVSYLAIAILFSAYGAAAQTTQQAQANEARPERRIVVSIADRKLALLEGERVVKVYDVAVGATVSPSPDGEFRIAHRLENPTYYHPGVVIGPGKNNPLGPRWIGLDVKGFGIHGTNRPDSIGKNASHGCIRLPNSDIEDLFARVQVGDRVSLMAERTEEVARLFGGEPVNAKADETVVAKNEVKSDEAHGER
ncbi:MAG TPA: L,D-transpeptidase [Candidatus Saccharimonadales bacterium]|nr:L,D-transpeptidase [Candidatus Saccharimonadales bacterium]